MLIYGLVKHKKKSSKGNKVLQPKSSRNTKSSVKRISKEVVKPISASVKSNVGKRKRLIEDKDVEDERDSDVDGCDGENDSDKVDKGSEDAYVSNDSEEEVKDVKTKVVKGMKKVVLLKSKKQNEEVEADLEGNESEADESEDDNESKNSEESEEDRESEVAEEVVKDVKTKVVNAKGSKDEKPLKIKKKLSKKNKKKPLTAEQIKKIKYLDDLPSLRSRTVPSSLFAAIRDSQVDMESFLSDIGFSSLHNVFIEPLPQRFARFLVRAFSASSYEFKLEKGIIRVTLEKVNEILGVPLSGTSIFDLPEIPLDDPFIKEWFKQFDPKSLKEICACDIAQKLVLTKTVDFMFNVNFLMLFANVMGTADTMKAIVNLTVLRCIREDTNIAGIDWCGFIHKCLQGSSEPKTLNGFYVGMLSFLILLYLDSTKFDKFPVIRQRPAIRNWTTTAMNRRQELKIEEQVIGFYDVGENVSRTRTSSLPPTDKKSFCIMIEEKISMISAEKIALEDLLKRANAEFPNDEKVIELCEKYRRLFKESVFVEDFQAHIDDFDDNDNDGGGKNDVHGSDNVGKKKESVAKDVLNAEKDGVNAKKDVVNVVQEGEAHVNEEPKDMLEEETLT
ncbi:hypothetical protein Tco_1366306 [Tanacetum coccineum]